MAAAAAPAPAAAAGSASLWNSKVFVERPPNLVVGQQQQQQTQDRYHIDLLCWPNEPIVSPMPQIAMQSKLVLMLYLRFTDQQLKRPCTREEIQNIDTTGFRIVLDGKQSLHFNLHTAMYDDQTAAISCPIHLTGLKLTGTDFGIRVFHSNAVSVARQIRVIPTLTRIEVLDIPHYLPMLRVGVATTPATATAATIYVRCWDEENKVIPPASLQGYPTPVLSQCQANMNIIGFSSLCRWAPPGSTATGGVIVDMMDGSFPFVSLSGMATFFTLSSGPVSTPTPVQITMFPGTAKSFCTKMVDDQGNIMNQFGVSEMVGTPAESMDVVINDDVLPRHWVCYLDHWNQLAAPPEPLPLVVNLVSTTQVRQVLHSWPLNIDATIMTSSNAASNSNSNTGKGSKDKLQWNIPDHLFRSGGGLAGPFCLDIPSCTFGSFYSAPFMVRQHRLEGIQYLDLPVIPHAQLGGSLPIIRVKYKCYGGRNLPLHHLDKFKLQLRVDPLVSVYGNSNSNSNNNSKRSDKDEKVPCMHDRYLQPSLLMNNILEFKACIPSMDVVGTWSVALGFHYLKSQEPALFPMQVMRTVLHPVIAQLQGIQWADTPPVKLSGGMVRHPVLKQGTLALHRGGNALAVSASDYCWYYTAGVLSLKNDDVTSKPDKTKRVFGQLTMDKQDPRRLSHFAIDIPVPVTATDEIWCVDLFLFGTTDNEKTLIYVPLEHNKPMLVHNRS